MNLPVGILALKELKKLARMAQRRIVKFLQERILPRNDPRDLGKAMAGDKAGLWRYRVRDYRLICHIDD
jgi:mRNA interferase RelE/StbE